MPDPGLPIRWSKNETEWIPAFIILMITGYTAHKDELFVDDAGDVPNLPIRQPAFVALDAEFEPLLQRSRISSEVLSGSTQAFV
ncbi:hypothetical protein ASD32_25600 [Rhizobium sp. Root483D2]|nr:hypothetical protein ASD32_25600 [Rhizobium sp. Root483D2]